MKKYGRFAFAALLLAFTLTLASCGASEEPGGSGEGMKGMDHEEMKHGDKSGGMKGMDHGSGTSAKDGEYSDKAFIDGMVVHHQGAVDMAQVALNNAEHEEISNLSKNIISTQKAEIKMLKSIKHKEFGTSRIPMHMGQEQMDSMGMMMEPGKLADRKPFDRAFIDAMIPHHQSAIEMSRTASEHSDNPDIKKLADDIISAQAREIEQMKSWRNEWYPEG